MNFNKKVARDPTIFSYSAYVQHHHKLAEQNVGYGFCEDICTLVDVCVFVYVYACVFY